jgi:PhnB protein
MDMNPYLTFPGTCLEAFEFYAEVFGGDVSHVQRVAESPMAGDFPPEAQDRVMHARVSIGDRLLMGSDNIMGGETEAKGFHIQTAFDDLDKAARVFARLARKGEVEMAFAPTFFATGFGMCRDRYGIPWMVNCDAPADGAPPHDSH